MKWDRDLKYPKPHVSLEQWKVKGLERGPFPLCVNYCTPTAEKYTIFRKKCELRPTL